MGEIITFSNACWVFISVSIALTWLTTAGLQNYVLQHREKAYSWFWQQRSIDKAPAIKWNHCLCKCLSFCQKAGVTGRPVFYNDRSLGKSSWSSFPLEQPGWWGVAPGVFPKEKLFLRAAAEPFIVVELRPLATAIRNINQTLGCGSGILQKWGMLKIPCT